MDSYWRRSVRIKSPSPANAEEEYRSTPCPNHADAVASSIHKHNERKQSSEAKEEKEVNHSGGAGGSEALSGKLAQIDEMRYAVLVMVYGHIVKHRLILLIIWNPMNVMAKKQLTVNATRERAHRC
eukprot:990938_1